MEICFAPSDVLLNSWRATRSCATKTGLTAPWLSTHKITKSAYPCFVLTPVKKNPGLSCGTQKAQVSPCLEAGSPEQQEEIRL